jgi:hypothetical protein
MYQVIGLRKLLAAFGGTAALVAVCDMLLQILVTGGVPGDFTHLARDLWSMAQTGITVAAVIFGLGETPVFAWACRATPLGMLFPPIEGEWTGELTTNWPTIASMAELPAGDTKPIAIAAYVKARLFTVGMETKSATGYSSSETLTVGLAKHGLKDVLRLAYVYEGKTPQPLVTDSSQHYGSAILDLHGKKESMTMEGSYWTNRNWTKGLNTAGRLILRRT